MIRAYAESRCEKPLPKGEMTADSDEMRRFIRSKKPIVDLQSLLPNNRTAYWPETRKQDKRNVSKDVEPIQSIQRKNLLADYYET